MSKIEINLEKVCPHLMANPAGLKSMSVDLQMGIESNDFCEVGENNVDEEVLTDLMTKPETVQVEVSCEGCKFLPGGFTKTIGATVKN